MSPVKKSLRILIALVFVLLIGTVAVSGFQLYRIERDYKLAEARYNELSDQVTSTEAPSSQVGEDSARVWDEFSPITVDFEELRAQNADVAAWLYSPDTPINYPVVHAADSEQYLNHFIDGSRSSGGTPFIDSVCAADFSDQNTIIYGHNMKDYSMFASLRGYSQAGYYEQHPCLYLNTPAQNYRVDLFTGFLTDAESDVYTYEFSDGGDFERFLEHMRELSDFDSTVQPGAGDHIVTLSTCSYEFNEARYVVQGVLVPIG